MMKHRVLFKLGSLALAAAMTLSVFGGCASSGEASSQASGNAESSAAESSADETKVVDVVEEDEVVGDDQMTEYQQGVDDPVTLNVFINGALDTSTYGKDIVSTTITEKTGVTLKFDVVPNDEGAKLNLLISSDQLPDLVFAHPSSIQGVNMINNDMVYSMDELLGQHAPNALKSTLCTQNNRSVYALYQQGGFYGVPAEFTDRNKINDGVFINQAPGYYVRQDLLDEVGMPELKTLADLEAALVKIHEKHPELKHPLLLWNAGMWDDTGSGLNCLYYSMGGKGQYITAEDGSLKSFVRDPLYKDVLMYVNKLYNQGLVNTSDFTDNYDTQMTLNNQETWAVAAGAMWHVIVPHDTFAPMGKVALPIDPIAEAGVTYEAPNPNMNGHNIMFVSKKTEHPANCAYLIEYLMTDEGQNLVTAGIENEHWEWGGPDKNWIVPIGEAKTLMDQNFADWSAEYGTYKYNFVARNYFDSAFCWGLANNDEFKLDVYQKQIHGIDVTEFGGIEPEPGSDGEAISTKFETMTNNMIAQVCTAPSQEKAEELYDKYISDAEALGLADLEAIWTENHNANLELMNGAE